MRLICPNCDAQYEVDAAVIPEDGRDVQCSNCGHTWFQGPAGTVSEPDDDTSSDPSHPETPEVSAGPQAEPEDTSGDYDEDDTEEDAAPAPVPGPQRRQLDSGVADILKEEAEREQKARQEDASAETFSDQPDLGLETGAAPAPAARGRATPTDAEPETAGASRRDLLPDIEEINSTLNASSDRGADSIVTAEEEEAEQRSGFRRGFAAVVLVVGLAVLLYLLAPMMMGLHPALDGVLSAYVGMIDGWRTWLNTAIPEALEGATRAMNGDNG